MYSRTLRSFAIPRRHFLSARSFQTSSRLPARKDAQGKDDLKPEPNEMSKSASDDQAAAVQDAAFNPKKTSPESEMDTAGGESQQKGVGQALWRQSLIQWLVETNREGVLADQQPARRQSSQPRG